MKKILLLGLGALVICVVPAAAFHDGGVAHCNGCHTMHNSQDGNSVAFSSGGFPRPVTTGNNWLLIYENPTDTCLNCHYGSGSYHVWEDSGDVAAGYDEKGAGDFIYSTAANVQENSHADVFPVDGEAAGHTLVSSIGGRTAVDNTLAVAPGDLGANPYPTGAMRCTSCHDPHFNGGFRALWRNGQESDGIYAYARNWTVDLDATGISMFGPSETDGFHNQYRGEYADWCATCHPDIHDSGDSIHPTGSTMSAQVQVQYGQYSGSTDCVGVPAPCGTGSAASSYLAMVPFEDPDMSQFTYTGGPDSNSMVTCVTCHRAHGSSAMDAGRWDFNVTGLAEDGEVSGTFALPNPFDGNQRSLCNKCHAKDEYDTEVDFTPTP